MSNTRPLCFTSICLLVHSLNLCLLYCHPIQGITVSTALKNSNNETKSKYNHPDDADLLPLELPGVKIRQILPSRSHSGNYSDVSWDSKQWDAPNELKETLRFIPAKCKQRFQMCMTDDAVSPCYCSSVKQQKSCLTSKEGCSEREYLWINIGACNSNQSGSVDWSKRTWVANILLQTYVATLSRECQDNFERCAESVDDAKTKSYCAMMVNLKPVRGSPKRKLRKNCLSRHCAERHAHAMVDAACTRSVVTWEDGSWFAGTRLQVGTATLQLPCQERFQYCRNLIMNSNKTVDEKSGDNYCTLATVGRDCLWGDGDHYVCTLNETVSIYKAACNHEQFNYRGSGSRSGGLSGGLVSVVLVLLGCRLLSYLHEF